MADIFILQFESGVRDGLRFPKALQTIFKYPKVRYIAYKCFFINGILYLGMELLYQYFADKFFHEEIASPDLGLMSHLASLKTLVLLGVSWWSSFLHLCWTLGIYIATLILSTFWVQDIFDFLMAEKLKDIKQASETKGDKEAGKLLKQLEMIKF